MSILVTKNDNFIHENNISTKVFTIQSMAPTVDHCWDLLLNLDGLAQDCSNSIANALELLQSCIKPSIYAIKKVMVAV